MSGTDYSKTTYFVLGRKRTGMHRVSLLVLVAAVITLIVPVGGAIGLTVNATPVQPAVGETVVLTGTVTGYKTIAVYLFVTGPGLDPHGVTLDNLNIAAGHGLFTTAPVNMQSGTWSYTWDTSVIIGTLKPGNYTVHVVLSPVERMRFSEGESSSIDVMFLPPPVTEAETPLEPLLPVAALGIAGIALLCSGYKQE